MKIEARWNEGMHFSCSSPSQHVTEVDSAPNGAKTHGPSPMELLLEAAATCSGMDVVSILQKKRKEPEHFSVVAEGIRAETYPKKFTHVMLHYEINGDDLMEKDVELAIRLSMEKYCSVVAAISPDAEVSWDYRLNGKK